MKRMITIGFLWILWRQRNEKVFGHASKNEKAMSEEIRFVTFEWIKYRSKFGKRLSWESWCCNASKVVTFCVALAPR